MLYSNKKNLWLVALVIVVVLCVPVKTLKFFFGHSCTSGCFNLSIFISCQWNTFLYLYMIQGFLCYLPVLQMGKKNLQVSKAKIKFSILFCIPDPLLHTCGGKNIISSGNPDDCDHYYSNIYQTTVKP